MKVLFQEDQIQKRLKEVGASISSKFKEVTLLIVLKGGVYTGIDLSKYITIPCKIEFIKISSYGNKEESTEVRFEWSSLKPGTDLGDVIIVDDICDTGKSLDYLIKYILNNHSYQNIHTFTLLDKPSRRQVDVRLDEKGFTIDNLFVFGYGLDLNGYERNKLVIYHKE